jgi:glutathione S-transferase
MVAGMLLIGQYDSPFVRRVAIALVHYEMAFEHRPWSVWANADELARHNPLRRVPVLVLDDGTSLVESSAILDYLDEQVAPARRMLPPSGVQRRDGLRVCALATGLADKAVSLFYEPLLREAPSQVWIERCRTQIAETLDVLERERAACTTPFWLGAALGHADVALTCALRFTREAHPGSLDPARWPQLVAFAERCEALAPFRQIVQPLTVALRK